MENHRSTVASGFKLSLEAGVVERDEIVCWADRILETEEYDDTLAEISLSSNKTDKDIEALLAEIAGSEPVWDGVREMLGRMHHSLVRNPERLYEFIRYLERLCNRYDYALPDDLSFIIGTEDSYLFAEQGFFGSIDEVRIQLQQDLARFL